jgi:hypothetical protein
MKYILTTLLLFTFLSFASSQIKSFGFIAGGGYTVIDVQKVVDPNTLSDWNKYGLVFKGFGEYEIGEGKLLGLEAGTNRLYYWEYRAPGYSWYNWRTEWTINAVFYYTHYFGDKLYLSLGPGVHFFYNGTTFGIMASAGSSINISDKFSIPVAFRIEPIFGSGTPIAINLATGLRFTLFK